ncbi:MAG: type II toxin-antitoxin system RelE/ParE family toxin [Acidobacteria bacterium]|nr:type II toxin-antitoxin system RelE/ParE family toxin [Acidobacteriota bacterium]
MAAEAWRVRTSPDCDREISGLPRLVREKVLDILIHLSEEPFPAQSLALRRYNDTYRIRLGSGNYRLIYRVDARRKTISVLRVGLRATVYRGMRDGR